MTNPLSLGTLHQAAANGAAFRCRRRLQPGGGAGDKVFPPTFAGAVYAIERRRLPGQDEPVLCVVLDTVQSQASRMELALQEAIDAGELQLPLLVVDFSAHDPSGDPAADLAAGRFIDRVGRLTSLQLPHRLADAILRDSEIDGVAFRHSDLGKALNRVSLANATPVLQLCPSALVFGMWDSTGPKGGLGPKFERAVVSEIVGIGAEPGDLRRGVRRDPIEARASIKVIKDADGRWAVADAKQKGGVSPSEINHSSIPFPKERDRKTDANTYDGVTIDYAEQTTTLSLIALRRLRFPMDDQRDPARDQAAHTLLAALGLCAATLAFEAGLDLRSRCLLWPEAPLSWELLAKPGQNPETYSLDGPQARKLLAEAAKAAVAAGLPWPTDPVTLQPSAELAKLVRLSQAEAAKDGGESEEG